MVDTQSGNHAAIELSAPAVENLRKHALYKERSDVTHERDHAPVLANGKPIECLLLGHSFFERFKTTGSNTRFGPERASYPEFFNAGVGGDRIGNVIYRLTEKGLLAALKAAGVRYALLAMGTNDLANDKKPLQQEHIEQYASIIEALMWACPGIRLLVCGLAPKKKVRRQGIIEESNEMLQHMVREFAVKDPGSRIEYLPSDPELVDNLEPDGVHLSESGYDMFAESLWNGYQALRAEGSLT